MSSTEELASILRDRYTSAEPREAVTMIHLFGIEYADVLDGHSINDLAELGTGHRSYGTEIRKGMRLSRYVEPKK